MLRKEPVADQFRDQGREAPGSRVKERNEHMNRKGNLQAIVQIMVRRLIHSSLRASGTAGNHGGYTETVTFCRSAQS